MNAPIRPAPPTPRMPKGRCLIDVAVGTGAADSPDAPYLLCWLAHQAARHRDLLLNIDAASQIALAPAVLVGPAPAPLVPSHCRNTPRLRRSARRGVSSSPL
jgi:hypothetical protein